MMREVVIDRSKWRSGGAGSSASGTGLTKLLNGDGYMCCLGFACGQLAGVSQKDLLDTPTPSMLHRPIETFNQEVENFDPDRDPYKFKNTPFSRDAVHINDDTVTSRADKEQALAELFAANDIKLTFTGEYEDA